MSVLLVLSQNLWNPQNLHQNLQNSHQNPQNPHWNLHILLKSMDFTDFAIMRFRPLIKQETFETIESCSMLLSWTVQGYDTRFMWSITQTRLVLTWTKLRITDYFDSFIIMIKKCSAQHSHLLTPIKLIELLDEFTSSALQFHVITTIATCFSAWVHFHSITQNLSV